MKNASFMLIALAVVLGVPGLAQASIQVGDTIRFFDLPGSPGGEYGVAKHPNVGTQLFVTLCTERAEFLDFNVNGFKVVNISDRAVYGGVGPVGDPVSGETAWLYYNFAKGTLTGYDGSAAKANQLQNAIWKFEGESNNISNALDVPDATYWNLANAAPPLDKAAALTRVRVLNLTWATTRSGFNQGERAQDVLVTIPEATTFFVWSVLGLIGFYGERRNRLDGTLRALGRADEKNSGRRGGRFLAGFIEI